MSCLISMEEWIAIYSYDLVGWYVVGGGGQRFLLSLLCNQSGMSLHMLREDLAVRLDFTDL